MKFRWIYNSDESLPITEQIKVSRNYPDSFFSATFADIPDISLMKDITKAATRIVQAVKNKEKIIIFGHDDLDGITATYILFDFLEKIGSQNHFYYIPNRLIENHGIQENFIRKVKNEKFDLVITVDGGISSYEAVKKLNEIGCEVIITDHHLVPEKIPPALAVVNPKQHDCKYPYKMLAGVGVSFFLVWKISQLLKTEFDFNYFFWVAAGSVADKVPLNGVNRILVRESLKFFHDFNDSTFVTLTSFYSFNSTISSQLGFINFVTKLFSNGREKDGEHKALRILLASPAEKARLIEEMLLSLQNYESQINNLKIFLDNLEGIPDYGFVYFDENNEIPYEFLGYCASYISRNNKIPVFFMKNLRGKLVCEARCTEGFNVVETFRFCKNELNQFGGHKQAAGFVAELSQKDKIREKIYAYLSKNREIVYRHKILTVDAMLTVSQAQNLSANDLDVFQPFGEGNPQPVIVIKDFMPETDFPKLNFAEILPPLDKKEKYFLACNLVGNNLYPLDFAKKQEWKNYEN
ncbi:MAG: hypothetical protein B6D62_01115 [Candidatus Cloacimonas sp. 4484_275]|nr:MAG: hypothetical protein B6D62_01115 [Candidatus Cloacimonas sp. 4484_275]RLC52644.1 MAG: DHH family phosphoesterase [Candidatus Cloacimonadota bacterium]